MQFETLPGFREFYPEACVRRNHIFDHWRQAARAFNFLEYDAPVLEPLELYIEKSGEEIVGQLFHFEDRGGRAVALRPEMTPSLARLVGARANSLKRPIKWFEIGEQYRYERPQKGRLRGFYQWNADILGESGPAADAELIALLVHALRSFGLDSNDFKVRLSDRTLWLLILATEGFDEKTALAILAVLDKKSTTERSTSLEQLVAIIGDAAEDCLAKMEIVLEIRDFESLYKHISGLPLKGDQVVQAEQRLGDWKQLLRLLKNMGALDFVQIDFGIVRGLAYYTGFVFEAFEASGQGRALAGGGRYDGLVEKLGGQEMPAVGFAMGDVTLADLLDSRKLLEDVAPPAPDFFIITGNGEERDTALTDAARLRAAGHRVDYTLKDQSFGRQFKEADRKKARFALVYGSDELARGVIKVRDLSNGVEKDFSREHLPKLAADWLSCPNAICDENKDVLRNET